MHVYLHVYVCVCVCVCVCVECEASCMLRCVMVVGWFLSLSSYIHIPWFSYLLLFPVVLLILIVCITLCFFVLILTVAVQLFLRLAIFLLSGADFPPRLIAGIQITCAQVWRVTPD